MGREAGKRGVAIMRRAVTLGWGAVLLWGILGVAHAGMFDDEEARRMIAAEKKRVDELTIEVTKQQEAFDARVGKLEESAKNQAVLDLFTQLEALRHEVNKLRGQVEVLNNTIENAGKRQRDMYIDLDARLRRVEQQRGPVSAPAPAAPAAASAAPAAPAAPAATAAAGPAVAVATTDVSGETRAYEAAQSQRRIGNYQGAIVAFQNFIKQYPGGSLAPRAQYWIGDSYFNLRDFRLAIASQQTLIRSHPGSPTVPDAMLNIASSQIELGELSAGRQTLEDLVMKYPVSEAADKARRRLAALNAPAATKR